MRELVQIIIQKLTVTKIMMHYGCSIVLKIDLPVELLGRKSYVGASYDYSSTAIS